MLMAGNAKEADRPIWFGREAAREARGKFKDLVCLVVFLCWIKRFVLLICLKCKYMNRYFSSFQKSKGEFEGGGGGGTRPRPPRIAAYAHTPLLYRINVSGSPPPPLFRSRAGQL